MTPTRRRRILLDLDNMIAHFNKHYANTFGIHPQALHGDNTKFWQIFDTKPVGFFRNIPPFIGSKEFVEKVIALAKKYDAEVAVLTAIPKKSIVPTAEREKNEWVLAQNYSISLQVLIGPYAEQKQNHCRPGDVLIDDNHLNIEQWVAKGGIGILHKNIYDDTFDELVAAFEIADVNAIRVYEVADKPIEDLIK